MRTLTPTLETAQNNESLKPISSLKIFPTRIFFDEVLDYAIAGADPEGITNTPLKQDVGYNPASGSLATFWAAGTLKYAIQGNDTSVDTSISTTVKPGVVNSKIYLYTGGQIKRYSIDWSAVSSLSGSPFSLDASMSPSLTPLAIHAISDTECIAVCNDDGGFRILYINGTTEKASASRFMFPKFVNWEGDTHRTMESLALFSGAAKLGTKPFAYISNAGTGMVQGVFYDPDTDTWSDIFTALPTDLQVSLCEFRIANVYTHNNFIYMCGQFHRTDVYGTAKDYSLILRSEDGKTFSIDNFTLVTDLNYRFLAREGEGYLFIGNSNRVASKPITWYFDGDDDTNSVQLEITEDDIFSINDTDNNSLSVSLSSKVDQTYLEQYARVKLYFGLETEIGPEMLLYGTYIMDAPRRSYKNGGFQIGFNATGLSVAKLTGLSMPFYAEIAGISSIYDPMNTQSGKLYAAPNQSKSVTKFQVDFFQYEGYANTGSGITAVTVSGNAPNFTFTGSHKKGVITSSSIQDLLGSSQNPKITAATATVKIYGWSKPTSGSANDNINLILVHCDANGENEQTIITSESHNWKITYPSAVAGEEPITINLTGLTVGRYIKYIGLVMEAANSTLTVPARVEFTNNVEVPISTTTGDLPWTLGTDGTFKVPGSGQPFIMFAQRPYNVVNFVLSAKFSNNVTGGITGYPVAVGLVGLAEDASNCIIARFDIVSNKAQLVKIRNGIETTLIQVSPAWTVGEEQSLQFKHRDGRFELYIYRDSTTRYELVLSYDWKETDDYMYTSQTSAMKCGIYGMISGPMCRTLSFSKTDTQEGSSSSGDGLPVDPLSSIADFPSSGRIRLGEEIYTYSGKISHPAIPRGPYQLRNCSPSYSAFGDSRAGLETFDLDWNASNSLTTGYLIAIDQGDSYLSIGDLWRVFTIDAGHRRYLPDRVRHYSANRTIGQSSRVSANNRVWVVGGFTGLTLFSGDASRHSVGEWASLELDGEIHCHWFMGAGGEDDTTVEDLVGKVCALSGAKVGFPGDFLLDSLVVSGDTDIYQDDFAEGFDLSFELDSPSSFEIRTNVKIFPDNYEEKDDIASDTATALKVESLGGSDYIVTLISNPSGTEMFKLTYSSGDDYQKFRVLYYGNNVSLYQDNRWVTTIALDKLVYTQEQFIDIDAYSASSLTFRNLRIKDLGDWREAVYIDLETDGNAAISSIIQERPVEIVSQPDGSMNVYYEYTRDEIDLVIDPQVHEYQIQDPEEAGSDAIIYGAGDVQTIQYRKFAQTKGLSTKLIRIPNLDVGALEAAQRMLDRFYEARGSHTIGMRPNLKLQPADKLSFTYTPVGGVEQSFVVIIESITMNIQMSKEKTVNYKISARDVLP
jgi:hypothetical protein